MDVEMFAYPWVGILANIQIQQCNAKELLITLNNNGVEALRVKPLWTSTGFTGFALVEFRNDWLAFATALKFETEYEFQNKSRSEWFGPGEKDGFYGWLARAPDFLGDEAVARHLTRSYERKTITDIMEENRRKNRLLAETLKRKRPQNMDHPSDDKDEPRPPKPRKVFTPGQTSSAIV